MVWPPADLPTTRTDSTPQVTNHPADHNNVNLAMNDTTDEIQANNAAFDRGNQTSEDVRIFTPGYLTLWDTVTNQPLGGGSERHVANLYRLYDPNQVGSVSLHTDPNVFQQLAQTLAYGSLGGEDVFAWGRSNVTLLNVPIPWNAPWDYQTPATASAPSAGEIIHADNLAQVLSIHKTDYVGVDHSTEMSKLRIGDTIVLDAMSWEISVNPVDQTDYYDIQVSPATQTTDRIAQAYFTPAPCVIEYGVSLELGVTSPDGTDGSRSIISVTPNTPTLDIPLLAFNAEVNTYNAIAQTQPTLWARALSPVPFGASITCDLARTTLTAIQYADTGTGATGP